MYAYRDDDVWLSWLLEQEFEHRGPAPSTDTAYQTVSYEYVFLELTLKHIYLYDTPYTVRYLITARRRREAETHLSSYSARF